MHLEAQVVGRDLSEARQVDHHLLVAEGLAWHADEVLSARRVALLAQQLEQAKIAEAKDLPTVQVLDQAVPAVRHSKPSKRINLGIAGIVSIFVSSCLAFTLDYFNRIVAEGRRARL